jgi:hypothetical protein
MGLLGEGGGSEKFEVRSGNGLWGGACGERLVGWREYGASRSRTCGEGGEKLEKLGGLSLVGVVGGEDWGVRDVGRAGLRRISFVTLRDWSRLVSMGSASCSGAAVV